MRRVIGVALSLATAAILISLLRASPRERQIRHHVRMLENATYSLFPPKNWQEAITWKRLRARLSRVSAREDKDPGSILEEERNTLVTLGYFERKTLTLASSNLMSQFSATTQVTTFDDVNWSYSTREGTNITLTAFRGDIPKWERIVSNLNSRAQHDAPR